MAVYDTAFNQTRDLTATFGTVIQTKETIIPDPFPGPYEVTPGVNKKVLRTKEKNMVKDFTVNEIPYAETSNQHGTTVVIAS